MTVKELKDALSQAPDDATVILKQQLICDDHHVESVVYKPDDYRNKEHGVLWLYELPY